MEYFYKYGTADTLTADTLTADTLTADTLTADTLTADTLIQEIFNFPARRQRGTFNSRLALRVDFLGLRK